MYVVKNLTLVGANNAANAILTRNIGKTTFKYQLLTLLKELAPHIEVIGKVQAPLNQKYQELIKATAEKDDSGNVKVSENGQFVISNVEAFNAGQMDFKSESDEFNRLMETTVEFSSQISLSLLPEEGISAQELVALQPFIKE